MVTLGYLRGKRESNFLGYHHFNMKCKPQIQPQAHSFDLGKVQLCLGSVDEALTWHDHGWRGHGIGAQAETPTFGQPVAQQGDVFLQPASVFG